MKKAILVVIMIRSFHNKPKHFKKPHYIQILDVRDD